MFPVPNGAIFVSGYDMVARRLQMSYSQVIDQFKDDLTETDLNSLLIIITLLTVLVFLVKHLVLTLIVISFPKSVKN